MIYPLIYVIGLIIIPIITAIIEKKFPGILYIRDSKDEIELTALSVISLMWPLALFFLFIFSLKYWIEN